jgi:hypothetical protein
MAIRLLGSPLRNRRGVQRAMVGFQAVWLAVGKGQNIAGQRIPLSGHPVALNTQHLVVVIRS